MAIKLRALPKFPASIIARAGLALSKLNGVYTFFIRYRDFESVVGSPDFSAKEIVIYERGSATDGSLDLYNTLPVSSLQGAIAAQFDWLTKPAGYPLISYGNGSPAITLAGGTGTGDRYQVGKSEKYWWRSFDGSTTWMSLEAAALTINVPSIQSITGLSGSLSHIEATSAESVVMADSVLTMSGVASYADSGATRAVARALGAAAGYVDHTADTLIRASEHQVLRGTGTTGGTWGMEIGVHSQVLGDGATKNLGIYLASSHAGWLPTGVRNDTAIFICGEDGWYNAIRYLDTDGSTVLFNIDQHGAVAGKSFTASDDVPWTAYTPTITPGGGAFTSVSCPMRYTKIGKKVRYTGQLTVTTIGTASGRVNLTLPIAPGASCQSTPGVAYNIDQQVSHVAAVNIYSSALDLFSVAASTPYTANGQRIVFSGEYEID